MIDLIERRALDLSQITHVVLDEADAMLNVGFEEDVETILEAVPTQRQTLLFSATMPAWVKKLTRKHLTNPALVDLVGDEQAGKLAETITALAVQVTPESRRSVLVDLLTVYCAGGKGIVFTQTKREADEVAAALALTLPCEALHGDIAQKGREAVLKHFRDGKFNALVATDVAARGLDIPDVDVVIHYDLPSDAESFLHRSGRTGRAGKTGTAIAMFTAREAFSFRRMLRDVKVTNVELISPPGPEQVMAASARQVLRRLDKVDADVQRFFEPAADAVLASGADARDALAAALAAMSGLLEVPQERSLLSLEVGSTTLRVLSRAGRIAAPGHVMTIVRNLLGPQAADDVGRVRMLTESGDSGETGAAFDVPTARAAELLACTPELEQRGFKLDKPTSLPMTDMQDDGRSGEGQRWRGGGGGCSLAATLSPPPSPPLLLLQAAATAAAAATAGAAAGAATAAAAAATAAAAAAAAATAAAASGRLTAAASAPRTAAATARAGTPAAAAAARTAAAAAAAAVAPGTATPARARPTRAAAARAGRRGSEREGVEGATHGILGCGRRAAPLDLTWGEGGGWGGDA